MPTQALLKEQCFNQPLVLHSDNGSSFKGATLRARLTALNIEPSYSRPRVSNDNPFSESLFATCKAMPAYPANGFDSLEAAREWVHRFVQWYNHEHRHGGIQYVTPVERHNGDDVAILARRQQVYAAAKARNPRRWSRETRDWRPVGTVHLNPEKEPRDSRLAQGGLKRSEATTLLTVTGIDGRLGLSGVFRRLPRAPQLLPSAGQQRQSVPRVLLQDD